MVSGLLLLCCLPCQVMPPASSLIAAMRLFRRVTGMKAAGSNDMASRWMRRYTSNCFATVLRLHEVVRPLLGCGMGKAPLPP